jgi:hypothetical protein
LLARCRSERPEALGNLRRRNGASVVIFTPDLLVNLGDCLRDPPPHGSFQLTCSEIKFLFPDHGPPPASATCLRIDGSLTRAYNECSRPLNQAKPSVMNQSGPFSRPITEGLTALRQTSMICLIQAAFCIGGGGILMCSGSAFASDDAARNAAARKDCIRGTFKDYYLQGRGGDPPANYRGRVFKLSQDYPTELPPKEAYPWLKIAFKDGAPVDPQGYLQALLDYALKGNIDVGFYVEDNKVRKWYGMPWMDWNTEVAADWPGTDGREYVHGLTHEFDSAGNTFGETQREFVDTWAQAYFNDRYAFSIGQVYCHPDDPKPGALNPDPTGLNSMPDGHTSSSFCFRQ